MAIAHMIMVGAISFITATIAAIVTTTITIDATGRRDVNPKLRELPSLGLWIVWIRLLLRG